MRIDLSAALLEWLALRPIYRPDGQPLSAVERVEAVPRLANLLTAEYAKDTRFFGRPLIASDDLPRDDVERVASELLASRMAIYAAKGRGGVGVKTIEWMLANERAKRIVGRAFKRTKIEYMMRVEIDSPEAAQTFREMFEGYLAQEIKSDQASGLEGDHGHANEITALPLGVVVAVF